jgi:hypothetical protein
MCARCSWPYNIVSPHSVLNMPLHCPCISLGLALSFLDCGAQAKLSAELPCRSQLLSPSACPQLPPPQSLTTHRKHCRVVISLVGSCSATFLSFIMPGACGLSAMRQAAGAAPAAEPAPVGPCPGDHAHAALSSDGHSPGPAGPLAPPLPPPQGAGARPVGRRWPWAGRRGAAAAAMVIAMTLGALIFVNGFVSLYFAAAARGAAPRS